MVCSIKMYSFLFGGGGGSLNNQEEKVYKNIILLFKTIKETSNSICKIYFVFIK